jgi:hydroxyethylthiazole kinase-like uncharacterized protein yjeF
MTFVLTPAQMRAADAAACAETGADTLMRLAGSRVAQLVTNLTASGRIVAFAGPGNNGGDAFAALAELKNDYERIICAAPADKKSDARLAAEERARQHGVAVRAFPTSANEARALAEGAAVTIDALLGTGARLPLDARLAPALAGLDPRDRTVVAIDVPSGIDALAGTVPGPAVRATHTVTLASLKPGLLLEPARLHVGTLWLADIGISEALLSTHARGYAALDDDAFLDLLPLRAPTADKRSAGAPLVVAGSAQFPGAAILCARGAARAGAGYVTLAAPPGAMLPLRQHLVEQVVVELRETAAPEKIVAELLDISQRNGAVAIGPGLGLDERTGTIVRGFIQATELPLVIDASALFHLAKHLDLLKGKHAVVTPHEGEFARLSGEGSIAPGTRAERLRAFVARTGITTLLKGLDTLIDDGTTLHINTSGTSALATAGSGDVLTGMIATLLAQGLSPVDAARAGAYWHGLAGQHCARRRAVGVLSGDLPDALAAALPVAQPPYDLRKVF